jgi:outer membrane autotransporter protein
MFSSGFEIGRELLFGTLWAKPSVGLHYIRLSSPHVTESGAGDADLLIHSHHYNSVRMPVGIKLSRGFWGSSMVWRPEVRAFYIQEFADTSVRTSTSFATAPGNTSFYAESGHWGRNSARFGTGLNARLSDWIQVRVDYDYEVFKHTSAQEFGATLGMKW